MLGYQEDNVFNDTVSQFSHFNLFVQRRIIGTQKKGRHVIDPHTTLTHVCVFN